MNSYTILLSGHTYDLFASLYLSEFLDKTGLHEPTFRRTGRGHTCEFPGLTRGQAGRVLSHLQFLHDSFDGWDADDNKSRDRAALRRDIARLRRTIGSDAADTINEEGLS